MQGSSPSSPAGPRLWRPAAQRNVRNSWSSINMQRAAWAAASAKALSAATALVNAHLSHRYVASMDLGVLKDMDDIRAKARVKLFYQQEGFLEELLRSYKDLVQSVSHMVKAKDSMRTYVKGSVTGPRIEFSNEQNLNDDTGDGGGIAVFSTLSLPTLEMLAEELVAMFLSEIKIKWLLVLEFHSIVYSGVKSSYLKKQISGDLLHDLPFETDVKTSTLGTRKHEQSGLDETLKKKSGSRPKREVLQVYLTAWLAEVNINKHKIEETLKMVSEEIQFNLPA